jgi:hypothetical protein
MNALDKAPTFIVKFSFPKWLETGVVHKCHVFHLFSGDGVDDCIGVVLLRPVVISEFDGDVGSVHAA